jgi:predicted transcriptional regulator
MASRRKKSPRADTPRLSVSLSKELYGEVEKIAKRDSRSMGWVIRKAVEDLVKAELPLFHQSQ